MGASLARKGCLLVWLSKSRYIRYIRYICTHCSSIWLYKAKVWLYHVTDSGIGNPLHKSQNPLHILFLGAIKGRFLHVQYRLDRIVYPSAN